MSTLTPISVIKLSKDEERDLSTEIDALLTEHTSDTSEYARQLVVQRRLYEMKSRRKTWPWPGASNIILPILRLAVDQYASRIRQSFRQTKDMWHGDPVVQPKASDTAPQTHNWKNIAESAAKFLNYVSLDPMHLNLHEGFFPDAVDLLVKDGTVPIKVYYSRTTKPRTVVVDGKITVVDEPDEDRVCWDPTEITRCTWAIGASNPESSTVFGNWTEMSSAAFRRFCKVNSIPTPKMRAVLEHPDLTCAVEEERLLLEEMGIDTNRMTATRSLRVFRVHELSIEWAIKETDVPAVLTVWWHQGSQTLLKVFDPTDHAKPWEIARFIRRGKQMVGASIPEALRGLNLGANVLANQTTDSNTIANSFGVTFKGDSKAAAALAGGVYPGVKIPVDEDVKKEFGTFQLGTGAVASSLNLLNFYLQMAEMVAKVGPSQLGQVAAGSRTAASVGLGILQEGAQMIDAVTAGFRDTLERCGLRTLFLYANHNPELFDEILGPEDATELLTAIRDASANFPRRIRISLNVSSAAASNEKDKQDLIVLSNFMMGVWEKILAGTVPFTNPQVPAEWKQIAVEVYKGMNTVITALISKFEQFRDPSAALPPTIIQLLQDMAGAGAAPPTTGLLPRIGPNGAGASPTANLMPPGVPEIGLEPSEEIF